MSLPAKSVDCLKSVVKTVGSKNKEIFKEILSSDALEALKKNKIINIETTKSLKEVFYNFFGMSENWRWGRNILGAFMVHCPEYPTYFIPSYTQAKATGDASELKKGEGSRGIITGGLEGIAVGALVSGEFLKPREMIPYIILGASLQLFSSKVFPWIGEKAGQYVYHQRLNKQPPVLAQKPALKPEIPTPNFKSKTYYNKSYSSGLKI